MEKFRDEFSTFYDALQTFLSELDSNLQPDAAEALQDASVLAEVVTPDDPDFSGEDANLLTQKFYMVYDTLMLMLNTVGSHLQEGSEDWFSGQDGALREAMFYVRSSLREFVLTEETQQAVSSGLGGVNSGFTASIGAETIQRLMALYQALQQLQ